MSTVSRVAATLSNPRPHLGLVSAISLPTGGLLCVDLFRLDVPVQMFLGRAELADDAVWRVAQAFEEGAPDRLPHGVALPERWVRLAVVTGVDRWFEDRLDETLLAADRALALSEGGDQDGARRLFTDVRLRFALANLANVLAAQFGAPSSDHHGDALLTELLRVLDAAPSDIGAYTNAASELRAAQAGQRVARRATDAGPTGLVDDRDLALLLGSSSPEPGLKMRLEQLDRLLVPARVVRDFRVGYIARDGEDTVEVECAPFPGVTAEHPAMSRLLVRLRSKGGETLSLAALSFDPDEDVLLARLSLHGRDFDDVVVDVFDSLGVSAPRIGPRADQERKALAQAQRAFTDIRLALSKSALGAPDSIDHLLAAREALSAVHDGYLADVAGEYVRDIESGTSVLFGTASSRPLLAELYAARD